MINGIYEFFFRIFFGNNIRVVYTSYVYNILKGKNIILPVGPTNKQHQKMPAVQEGWTKCAKNIYVSKHPKES